jgi:hypothetical protein
VPCWPDLLQRIKGFLWIIPVVAYIALVAVLFWAPKLSKRWMRITSRILGAVGVVPLVIVLPAFLFALLLVSGNPPAKTLTVRSPDGYEATLAYNAGFLGRDHTEVTLKRPGCCRHTVIFWHAGPSWFNDMKIKWVDNRHLHLTYHVRRGDPQHCENQVADVTIICTSLLWPDSTASENSSQSSRTH